MTTGLQTLIDQLSRIRIYRDQDFEAVKLAKELLIAQARELGELRKSAADLRVLVDWLKSELAEAYPQAYQIMGGKE